MSLGRGCVCGDLDFDPCLTPRPPATVRHTLTERHGGCFEVVREVMYNVHNLHTDLFTICFHSTHFADIVNPGNKLL